MWIVDGHNSVERFKQSLVLLGLDNVIIEMLFLDIRAHKGDQKLVLMTMFQGSHSTNE